MRRHFPTLCLSVLLLGAAGSAQAKEYRGWVYNGATGWGKASLDDLQDSNFASDSSIGYRWGGFGVEIGHAWFGNFKDSQVSGPLTIDTEASVSGWNAGLNFNHDLNERWALQLRGGLFNWDVDGSVDDNVSPRLKFKDSGNDWYAGASVTWQWRKRSSVGLGYTHYKAGDADLDVWGVASEYRFGGGKK